MLVLREVYPVTGRELLVTKSKHLIHLRPLFNVRQRMQSGSTVLLALDVALASYVASPVVVPGGNRRRFRSTSSFVPYRR